tara:strand:- start:1266 stop:1925 length:660 start_codon:yes stop_codon:yes gene_type:complete
VIDLVQVDNAARAPRADMNIELAHTYWEGSDFCERFRSEFERSMKLMQDLNIAKPRERVSISILIDDKRIEPLDKVAWFLERANLCKAEFSQVDYVVFESDLKSLLRSLYSKIVPNKKNAIQNDIERYVKSKRKTACSHDIALWHTMRSGALGFKGLPIFQVKGERSQARLLPSFCSTRVVSILNQSDREHEENAEVDILQYVASEAFDWRGVERNYYY